jgi:hypothetical protein
MKLKDLSKRELKTNIKDIGISDDGTVLNYVPMFKEDDVVKLKASSCKISADLSKINSVNLVVDKCKLADLGDMLVEVVYFKDTGIPIKNPYLVEYFSKVLIVQSGKHTNTQRFVSKTNESNT